MSVVNPYGFLSGQIQRPLFLHWEVWFLSALNILSPRISKSVCVHLIPMQSYQVPE